MYLSFIQIWITLFLKDKLVFFFFFLESYKYMSHCYKELSLFSYSHFTTTFVGKLQDGHFA